MGERRRKKAQLHTETMAGIVRQKKGATLVELVVTFTLVVIFALCTMQTIASSMKVYYQIRGLNDARQVADTVMDKITGELEGAMTGVTYEQERDHTLILSGNKVDLYDRTGSHIWITTDEKGYLLIHYYEVKSQAQSATGEEAVSYHEVDWTFGDDMYMGYKISELNFAQAGTDYPKNVIKVTMTLDGQTTFTTTRYVECYNFDQNEYDKIIDEGGE